jgi:type IV fimbrial biogenesis protein FimT
MRSRGFTLIELLVVVTISAILIAVAVPSFQWTMARNRVSDATNLLLSNLEATRMEATRRNNAVTLCRVQDPNATPPVCSSAIVGNFDGNDWAVGWVMFEKSGGTVTGAWEVGDTLILRQQSLAIATPTNTRVTIHTTLGGGGESFAYLPRGTGGTGIVGLTNFAVDHWAPGAPSANRPLGSISLSGAARCIRMTAAIGSMSVLKPSGGVCP